MTSIIFGIHLTMGVPNRSAAIALYQQEDETLIDAKLRAKTVYGDRDLCTLNYSESPKRHRPTLC